MPKKQDYLVGLDLGSSRTRCVVAIEEDSRLRFIAYGVAEVKPGAWDNGRISDPEAVLASLEAAIEQAERNGGMLVEAAVAGVGGPQVRSNISHAALTLNSWEPEIERSHVDEAVRRASQGILSEERTVLQAVPATSSPSISSRRSATRWGCRAGGSTRTSRSFPRWRKRTTTCGR